MWTHRTDPNAAANAATQAEIGRDSHESVSAGRHGCRRVTRAAAVTLALACVLPVAGARAAQVWQKAAQLPIQLTGEGAAVGGDGRLYVIGGENLKTATYNQVFAYSPASDSWSEVSPLIDPRLNAAVAEGSDGRVYAVGGRLTPSTAEAYTPATNTWKRIAPVPTPRIDAGAATGGDGRLYVLGGVAGFGETGSVEAYDAAHDSWTEVAPMPTARKDMAVVADAQGRIWAIGGDANSTGYVNTVEVYTPTTNTWTAGPALPGPARADMPAVLGADGRLYVIGGFNGTAQSEVDVLNPATMTWSRGTDLLIPTGGNAGGATRDGRIHTIGNTNGDNRTFVPAFTDHEYLALNEPPVLTVPTPGLVVEGNTTNGANVAYSGIAATDPEDGNLTAQVTCAPASTSFFTLGKTDVGCSVTDSGGLSASASFTVTVVDTTPPSLTHVPADIVAEARGPGGAAVSYSAPDAFDIVDSRPAVSCTPPSGSTFALDEISAVTCTATDATGNQTMAGFKVTVRDTTPPSLSFPAGVTAQVSSNGRAVVDYQATATDLVDGPVTVTCTPPSGTAFAAGTTSVSCSATDKHGNPATGSFPVTVAYDWTGFFQPVDDLGVLNVAKAGSTIPVKFSLNGDQGLGIFYSAGYPSTGAISCNADSSQDAIEEYATATVSGLEYDAVADQYQYNWKTQSAWAGTCRQLIIRLADGSYHRADFKFK